MSRNLRKKSGEGVNMEYEFKFYYPRLIESSIYGNVFIPRQYLEKRGVFGTTVGNRIYIFRFDTLEIKTIVALNHEVIHVVLEDIAGKYTAFTFDFIFKKEFLPVIRKLLGKKLGFIIGVYHSE